MADFSLQALHDYIELDPKALGLKEGDGTWKGDGVIADLINSKDFVIDREGIGMEDIRGETLYDAYNDLGADEQEWLRWLTPNGGEMRVNPDMKLLLTGREMTVDGVAGIGENIDSWWSLGNRDIVAPAILALIEVPGSAGELEWGEGRTIGISQVAKAANL